MFSLFGATLFNTHVQSTYVNMLYTIHMYNVHVSTCCTQYTCTMYMCQHVVQCTLYMCQHVVQCTLYMCQHADTCTYFDMLYNVHVSTCCTMYIVHVDNYRVSSGTLVVLLKTEKTVEAKPRIFSCLCCSQRAEHLQEYVVAGAERGNAHYSFETQINFKYLVNHHFKLTITHKL